MNLSISETYHDMVAPMRPLAVHMISALMFHPSATTRWRIAL